MSLQPRKIGETQAQYNRRVGKRPPRTVGRIGQPQKVEKVSVMPQDMKATIPNQEVIIKRRPQQPQPEKATAFKPTYTPQQIAKMQQEARARFQKQLEERKKLAKEQARVLTSGELKQFTEQQKEAIRKFNESRQQKPRQQQAIDPRTGKPPTQQQIADSKRRAKEFEKKRLIAERYMRGEIGRRDLRGTFSRQEIRNIEKGSVYKKFMDGKITDRQLSRSRMFSPREIRDIKRQLRIKRMSPQERIAYGERQRKERQRLDKMAEDRRTQPQRRRRRIRDAFRRMREDARSRMGRRRRPTPTRGTAPGRYRTRGQQERATGVRIPRRGRRGII